MQRETLPVLLHAAKGAADQKRTLEDAHYGGGWRRDAHYLLAQSSYPMMKITSYSLVDW